MVHIAIMKKSWGLIDKILSGEKTIESRWYKNRCRPWEEIEVGDTIYFKDSPGPVRAKAVVDKVIQFTDLNAKKRDKILAQYGKSVLGTGGNPEDIKSHFKDKRYCILVFFNKARKVTPFNINKTGFGTQSAWLIVDNINKIKL